MKTGLLTAAGQLTKTADTLRQQADAAEEMGVALDDAKYLIEGLHGDFTKKCCSSTDGELCYREECHEVGCIHQKYSRIKAALKRA